jgi:phosphopentomutase
VTDSSAGIARVCLVVLDGVGVGALPDAAHYGDQGSDTLGNVAARRPLRLPVLQSCGLGRLVPALGCSAASVRGAWGRMAEASAGKDSVTGHWEIAGLVRGVPFPTFPHGFPPEIVAVFEARIGRPVLGNVVASGTVVIDALGDEHVRTGRPILYTSADSVFQLAAHEDVVPVTQLYEFCEVAFDLVCRGLGVGRVIARPFVGMSGAYTRTSRRHDYALAPPEPTLLDRLIGAGVPVLSIGKVADLFAGRGISHRWPTSSDAEGLVALDATLREETTGLVFANLVDSDQLYGHRNDVEGFAANLERIDEGLGRLLPLLRATDLLVVTADHGNDPTTPSTDHAREYVPLLIVGARVPPDTALGTRDTFADLGQTIAEVFGVGPLAHGTSFLGVLHQPS